MAYVDENTVASQMYSRVRVPLVEFDPAPPEDESVDAEVTVRLNGDDTGLSIQVGGGYLCLNQYSGEGDSFGVCTLLSCGVQPDDFEKLAARLEVALLARRPA